MTLESVLKLEQLANDNDSITTIPQLWSLKHRDSPSV